MIGEIKKTSPLKVYMKMPQNICVTAQDILGVLIAFES